MEQIERRVSKLDKIRQTYLNLSAEKLAMLDKQLENFEKMCDDVGELNLDLRNRIVVGTDHKLIIFANDMQSQLQTLEDDSILIYVKTAQLYGSYNKNSMDEFVRDDRMLYFNEERYGPVYEVVRDSHPQKLVIVFTAELQSQALREIKKHIQEFVKSELNIANCAADVRIYGDGTDTEFIVNSVLLKDMTAKEGFIEKFIKYMKKIQKTELALQIQVHRPVFDELDGVRMYKLPSSKKLLDGVALIDTSVDLITNSKRPIIINQYVNISNSNNNNIQGNTGGVNTGVIKNKTVTRKISKAPRGLKDFYIHLFDTRPSWYEEEEFVEFSHIEKEYREFFDDNSTTSTMISRSLGALFSESARGHGITKKKLISFEKLESLL